MHATLSLDPRQVNNDHQPDTETSVARRVPCKNEADYTILQSLEFRNQWRVAQGVPEITTESAATTRSSSVTSCGAGPGVERDERLADASGPNLAPGPTLNAMDLDSRAKRLPWGA